MDGIVALKMLLKVFKAYSKAMVDDPSTRSVTFSELINIVDAAIQELEDEENSDFDSAMEGYPEE